MYRTTLLVIVPSLLAGAGAIAGSIAGNAFGRAGLFLGAGLGGLLVAFAAGPIARWLGWIRPDRTGSTAIGAGVGFLLAAAIATQTLGSPVGPVLSTFLVGLGALIGSVWHGHHERAHP